MDNGVKTKVLFICVHNSARSQMAEAWLSHICGEFFVAQSAGLEPRHVKSVGSESDV
jgi:protein-tyrosine-phosphatase